MAIFSLHCKIIGKGQQKSGAASVLSAVAAAAYRAGEKLQDIAAGMTHDFTKKGGVVHSEIMLPVGGPERLRDRATLWNEVQNLEKRKDGQYCREIMIAMPTEFTNEENIRLARAYIRKTFVDKGMIADFSLHDPYMVGGHRNPHIHVMLTMRELTPDGKLGKKNRAWNDDGNMERWRERWAITCNKWLEKGGFEARIDHRTNAAQGLGTLPTVHLGSKAAALERKGVKTAKGNINRSICAYNIAKECGVEETSILSRVELQWQYVRQFRGDVGSPRSLSRKSRSDGLGEKMRDTDRTGVQRRTYTLLRNVVRSGQTPTPPDGEKDALRGDRNGRKTDSGAGQRDETATLSGDAVREHAAATPVLQQATTRLSFVERLMVLLHIKKKEMQQDSGYSSMYNIKVMASTLNALSKEGIGSYRQMEEKLSGLESNIAENTSRLEKLDKAMTGQQRILGAALNCQANRAVAEQYVSKTLFRDNFLKLHRKEIEAFAKGREELRAAGVPDDVTPAQIRAGLDELRGRRVTLVADLKRQRGEHERWSRIKERVENILEGKPVKSERRQPEQQRKENAHDREGRGDRTPCRLKHLRDIQLLLERGELCIRHQAKFLDAVGCCLCCQLVLNVG